MFSDPYKSLARWYDTMTAWALKDARSRLVDICRRNKWRKILDIGCGTGMQIELLHRAGIRCCGLDASSSMLAVARKRLPPTIPLILGRLPLPFSEGFFDAGILSLILHETDNEPEELLRDALRTAPVCVVLEWREPEGIADLPGQIFTHAAERMAGKRHYLRFRSYTQRGWLRGLAARVERTFVSEESVCGGLLTLVVLS
jgi:ubiquinone/menaquinone biosynthesis C-methylase UbiE